MKLSSMDTLIEQEDKHMEIAVQKLMSLRPDVILVARSIARKAQEILCEHNVVVMQNVKLHLLERIGRMTGAMLLPSTDHMIKQFGAECLGTCAHFRLNVVHDDPERRSVAPHARRILETRVARGSTYAHMQGCPSERGCSIILRGGDRATLKEVKRILRFSVVVAYHLRLEVAYYNDRCASLPPSMDDSLYDDGSDVDEEGSEGGEGGVLGSKCERQLLSTSLDIDIGLPFHEELLGTELFYTKRHARTVDAHQTLLVASLLMGESAAGAGAAGPTPPQRTSADVKGIKFYTKQDIALGQFVIDNCFQLTRAVVRESSMLEQTLSLIHRPGRVDIS
ncbi:GroEL-like apical domain-containing protein, partial [Ochromonadaceae sp. CCMP2298]